MGTTLTGTQINNTYTGLVKLTDNAAVSGTLKALTDGAGNDLPIEVSSTGVNFTGTVTGIAGAGMVSGTGTDSIQSAAALTTTSALAQGNNSIAIGDNAKAFANNSIVIGTSVNDADPVRFKAISIGNDLGTAQYTVNIGLNQNAYGASGVCIGESNGFGGDYNVAIGYSNSVTVFNNQVVIGNNSSSSLLGGGAIGSSVTALWANGITFNQIALQNYASLNYADDTAAAAGGVPLGGVYHTSGALKVRIV